MEVSSEIDPATVVTHPASAGLIGSMVALRYSPGATLLERVLNLMAGSVIAIYLGPFTAEWFHLPGERAVAAVSFLIGLFGLNLTNRIVEEIKNTALLGYFTRNK